MSAPRFWREVVDGLRSYNWRFRAGFVLGFAVALMIVTLAAVTASCP